MQLPHKILHIINYKVLRVTDGQIIILHMLPQGGCICITQPLAMGTAALAQATPTMVGTSYIIHHFMMHDK